MKKIGLVLAISTLLFSCKTGDKAPDISGIKLDLGLQRFDKDFFAIDTNNLQPGMSKLQSAYPNFLNIYLQNIVGVQDAAGIISFYRSYKPVFDSVQLVFSNFEPIRKDFETALRFVKHYFPNYKTPSHLVSIIGPMNSGEDMARMSNGELTPDFIGPDLVGVSLQYYLGQNFSLYDNEYFVNNVAPRYRSRRFSKEYIVPDAMKLITDDIFPEKSKSKTLVEQMIERGKQWWMLEKFLPNTPDSLITGYTKAQLDWCKENEGLIWSYIIKNEDLYTNNPTTIQTYIGEGPFTQGFSQEQSPGNLGAWIGRQILRKFATENQSLSPEAVMTTDAKKILDNSKYRPK